MRRRKVVVPPVPTLERAMEQTQGAADRSGLPLRPYALLFDGLGWFVEAASSIGVEYNGFPVHDRPMHRYPVSVLPTYYFRR